MQIGRTGTTASIARPGARSGALRLVGSLAMLLVLAVACSTSGQITVTDAAIERSREQAEAAGSEPDAPEPDDAEDVEDAQPQEPDDPGSGGAPADAEPSVPAETRTVEDLVAGSGDALCRYEGIDAVDDMQLYIAVAPDLDEAADIVVDVRVTAGSSELARTSLFVEMMQPGERAAGPRDTFTARPDDVTDEEIRCDVLSVSTEPLQRQAVPVEGTCRVLGLDFADDVQIEIELTNGPDSIDRMTAVVAVSAGTIRAATTSVTIPLVAAGEQIRVAADTLENPPDGVDEDSLTCAVLLVEGAEEPDYVVAGQDACTIVEVDEFDDIQIELRVEQTTELPNDGEAVWVLRDPSGVRVGGSSHYVEYASFADGIAVMPVDTLTEVPDGLTVEQLSCELIGQRPFQ